MFQLRPSQKTGPIKIGVDAVITAEDLIKSLSEASLYLNITPQRYFALLTKHQKPLKAV